mgnify:CR=1 FL=1
MEYQKIINIAVIAHVDAGKSTLVDAFLKQSHVFKDNEKVVDCIMDSNDLERERGITIYSKNCSVTYKDYKINIVDTPGHADFSSEVERIIKTVDTVILLVDSAEGPMPQTRFVLQKSLEAGLRPILLINKMDKQDARANEVIDEVYELFLELNATDDQLDFPILFGKAREGIVHYEQDGTNEDIVPLFETIIHHTQAYPNLIDEPVQMQISALAYDDYIGRLGIGRVYKGTLKAATSYTVCNADGNAHQGKTNQVFIYKGLSRVPVEEIQCGEICMISGIPDINIGDTICPQGAPDPMPMLKIEEPTLSMNFMVNDSPFAGQVGKFVTSRNIRERLDKELEVNVGLKVEDTDSTDTFKVSGRGELHLSVLIENMRREGFELQVSRPEVIIKEIDGVKCEPFERVQIDTPEEYMGSIIESLSNRKGEMQDMQHNDNGQVRIVFLVPARGLLGYTTEFLSMTRGYGIMNHTFDQYLPYIPTSIGGRRNGALVSTDTGKATTYGIMGVEDRGVIFTEPGTEIYEGMIVGEHSRENDLAVNITKAKQQTNIRSATKDQTSVIKTPKKLSLEESLEFLSDDEYCEVTPETIRLRKQILNKGEREKANKRKKQAEAEN